jgi:ubiquitin carboxyl-terminal hydrolase L5
MIIATNLLILSFCVYSTNSGKSKNLKRKIHTSTQPIEFNAAITVLRNFRMSWCTIESDPGVFNEMLTKLGVKGVSLEEIWNMEDLIDRREPSYGLIFLFKWREETDNRPTISDYDLNGLIFMKQVVQNACATQALLSVILNTPDIQLGDTIGEFKNFVSILDSESRGMALDGSDVIRETHNSFARAEPFLNEETKAVNAEKEDAYHFIAYIPFQGKVYE